MTLVLRMCQEQWTNISVNIGLDIAPNFEGLTAAIASTRENKAPRVCGIPAEIWKYSGVRLQENLHELLDHIWRKEETPQIWKQGRSRHSKLGGAK